MSDRWNALVLAGRRPDDDASAEAEPRALLEVGGVPMLARVVDALSRSGRFDRVVVSIEDPDRLADVGALDPFRERGVLEARPSAASPARSVDGVLETMGGTPLLVTTADHALLTAEWVTGFLDAATATAADVAVALVERTLYATRHPAAGRTWIELRDGAYTGANLFALQGGRAADAVRFFVGAERHRKAPWRLIEALDPGLVARYLAGRLELHDAFARISRKAGATLAPIALAHADAAIDVDKPEDRALAERVLAERAGG